MIQHPRLVTTHVRFVWAASLGLLVLAARAESADPDLSMPSEIAGVAVVVPEPSMAGGLSEEGQAAVLAKVAGKYSLDRFTKASIVAPFNLQRSTIKDADGERVGHQIDLWFVAHGPLEAIASEDLFLAMAESGGDSGEPLPEQALAQRGLRASDSQTGNASTQLGYYQFSAEVLDRVIVEGVVRRFSLMDDESYVAGITLEETFDQDDEYPNQWRRAGEPNGESFAYSGYGVYTKATRLLGHDNALLIECHAVIHEPHGWFNGANLLGSKLPIAVQNTVRKFRRNLAKQR